MLRLLTLIAQQKLSAVLLRASRYDSDFDRIGVGQVDGLLIAVGRYVGRCLSTTHRHAVTAVHSFLDHCVDLLITHHSALLHTLHCGCGTDSGSVHTTHVHGSCSRIV